MKRRILIALLAIPLLAPGQNTVKQKEVKIQKSSIPRDKEIELGKQAAGQIEREIELVRNQEAEGWLNRIGATLARTPQANDYPYYFKLVNDDSINAFALPGGPMYVHTGLIKAADNEGQVAGVLAHEMSHVALRHGVSQMGKSQTWQTILGVAGAAAGMAGGTKGAVLGTVVNTGGALGVGGLLSKYSRDAERDADLNGARMLAAAGYNPLEMARFFEKLEAEAGAGGNPRGVNAWFASHPSPGKRVVSVSEDIRFYPQKQYTTDSGQFGRVKQMVGSLPPPKMRPAAALTPVRAQPRQGLPQGFADLRTKDFAVAYPNNWQAGQAAQGGSLYLVPQGGVAKSQNGGIELIAGAMIDYFVPENGNVELRASTNALLDSLRKGDPALRVERTEQVQVGGKPGLFTRLTTRSSYPQDPEQIVYFYSVVRPVGLWTMALAYPRSRFGEAEQRLMQILESVAFEK